MLLRLLGRATSSPSTANGGSSTTTRRSRARTASRKRRVLAEDGDMLRFDGDGRGRDKIATGRVLVDGSGLGSSTTAWCGTESASRRRPGGADDPLASSELEVSDLLSRGFIESEEGKRSRRAHDAMSRRCGSSPRRRPKRAALEELLRPR
jgi:hypothetical protein